MPQIGNKKPTYVTPPLALIAIEGPDAVKFLQGQLTCDLRELDTTGTDISSGPCLLGAQCNNKGRVLMVFHAFRPAADRILLQLNAELAASALANLRKYAVFFKAQLSDVTSRYQPIAVVGSAANSFVVDKINLDPTQVDTWKSFEQHFLVKTPNTQVFWLDRNSEDTLNITTQIAETCELGQDQDWDLNQIELGLASVSLNTQELFTPQDLNLTLINGVNFKKGCYTGQEIVARLHYKAKLKRHMYRFAVNHPNQSPAAGTAIRDSQGKHLGEVVLTARRDYTHVELLASINDLGTSDAFIEGISQKLRQLPLPYAIPSENEVTAND